MHYWPIPGQEEANDYDPSLPAGVVRAVREPRTGVGLRIPSSGAKWFYNQRGNGRRVNLHVRVAGRANQRYAVLSRDYLRANPATAVAYGQVKLTLAAYHADDVEAYYAIKDRCATLSWVELRTGPQPPVGSAGLQTSDAVPLAVCSEAADTAGSPSGFTPAR